MNIVQQAVNTQLSNIEKKTGKSLDLLRQEILKSGLTKHGELREWSITMYGLGYGDANSLVHFALNSDGERSAEGKSLDEVVDEIYSGNKSGLRPIHDAVMTYAASLGEFETVPKKGYVSLRRKKQFAMITPVTSSRVELGLNAKDLPADPFLLEQPKGGMCNYIVKLTNSGEFSESVKGWLKQAYLSAG